MGRGALVRHWDDSLSHLSERLSEAFCPWPKKWWSEILLVPLGCFGAWSRACPCQWGVIVKASKGNLYERRWHFCASCITAVKIKHAGVAYFSPSATAGTTCVLKMLKKWGWRGVDSRLCMCVRACVLACWLPFWELPFNRCSLWLPGFGCVLL